MDSLNDIEKQILQHIRNCMKQGQQFFKSKHIAKDIGLSSNEVGTNLAMMKNKNLGKLKIIDYAYSSGTTWKAVKCR